MKSQQEIEALSNQALNSLDKLQPAEANAFLYSKIRNRMLTNRQDETAKYTRLMVRLSAALVLFVCVNLTSFYFLQRWHKSSVKTTTVSGANAFSDEFLPKESTYSY